MVEASSGALERGTRSEVRLKRNTEDGVTTLTILGVVEADIEGFLFVRTLRLFGFISSIRLSPVSSVRQRAANYSYVSRSSRTGRSIRCRYAGSLLNRSRR